LLLFFVGAADYVEGQSCTARYVPVVEETESVVHVSIRSESPRPNDVQLACPAVGFPRSLAVELEGTFNDRKLVAAGASLSVMDGSTLAEPGFLPDGWQAGPESPGPFDPRASNTWIRSWSPTTPIGEDACALGASGLSLLEGDPDAVARSLPPTDQTTGTHDINGSVATETTQLNRNLTRLSWTSDDRSYVLTSAPACDGDQPPSLDVMLEFARGLET
jgi:hypothetical protein